MFESVCTDFAAQLIEMDGEKDHIHLLVNYPPKVSVSKLVNALKGVSSRLIRKKAYPSIQKALWEMLYGLPVISLLPVEEHRLKLFNSIYNSKKHLLTRLTSRP